MKALKKFASKLYLLPIGLVIMLSSCESYLHYPSYQYVPKNSRAKEVQITPFYSGLSIGMSAGYNINKNYGAFATFNHFPGSEGIADIGMYYYKPFESNVGEYSKLTLSSSLSYGRGWGKYNSFNLKMNRIAIQPSFAFASKFVDLGFSNRVSVLSHSVKITEDSYLNHTLEYLQNVGKKPFYFNESNIYIGVGYKWVKLNWHFNSTAKFNSDKIDYYKDDVQYFSLSIKARLGKVFENKNQ